MGVTSPDESLNGEVTNWEELSVKDTKRKYDFAGWVTKNDVKCSDGVTIKHGAFKANDGQQVPLVWNHSYKDPSNILGHVILQHHEQGVYGYGYFNDTEAAEHARKLVKHRDISSMSIGARKIKRSGTDIVHGLIYEVSLVLAGANPGALIDSIVTHSDTGEEEAVIFNDYIIHSADEIPPEEQNLEHEDKDTDKGSDEKTVQDVIDTMTPEQKEVVEVLLGMVADPGDDAGEKDKEEIKDEEGAKENMKHNVFDKDKKDNNDVLKHSINEALVAAVNGKAPSLKEVLAAIQTNDGESITHGINSIEMLFPEAFSTTNGNVPILYKDPNTNYEAILNGVTKSPFSRVRTLVADLTEDEARAKGYIKGNMKKEEFFSLIKRVTTPTTVYKKQKLDRDDIIDITDFDVVAFMRMEMLMMLKEELARAILVGDGRDVSAEDKINEGNIRPIISDNEFFTIHKAYAAVDKFEEAIINAMSEYRGSGLPTMYIDPTLLSGIKLLKGTDGRYLTGNIPSDAELATRYGLRAIVPTTFMVGKGALVVNLSDYNLGATKGGQITNFDDFDIDFNQYKYLIETRLSGALTMPKSAIHLAPTTAGTGATNEKAGMTYGERQADKTPIGG